MRLKTGLPPRVRGVFIGLHLNPFSQFQSILELFQITEKSEVNKQLIRSEPSLSFVLN